MDLIDEIKSSLDIVDIIRDYLPIKAAGVNFHGLCPFHKEKTPSFVVSPEKQIWHCFGCGKGGDLISFVQEIEGLSFPETLNLLANKAGISVKPKYDSYLSSKKTRLLKALNLAAEKYQELLNTEGKSLKNYLLKRSLSEKTILDWQIGYGSSSWTSLLDYLKTKGFKEDELMQAGLIGRSERGSYYDRFRDRIIFPIKDINSQVVAFTARLNPETEKEAKMGKYINSPQTEFYDKSRILFALDRAKLKIKERDYAIVVEGQMDAIACHQHGFLNTVASSGTALSKEQLRLLKRYSNNLIMSFDMDNAGQIAADRGIKEAMALEMNIKVLILPKEYKDPDEALAKDPNIFKEALIKSLPVMDYYIAKIKEGRNLSRSKDKKELAEDAIAMISNLHNKIEQNHYLTKLAEDLDISEEVLRDSLTKYIKKKLEQDKNRIDSKEELKPSLKLESSRQELLSEIFLSLLIRLPDLIIESSSHLDPSKMASESLEAFYKNLIIYYNKFKSFNYQDFHTYLKEQDDGSIPLLDKLSLLGERDYYNYEASELKEELYKVILELKRLALQARIKECQTQISQLEAKGEEDGLAKLMQEIKKLSQELNLLN